MQTMRVTGLSAAVLGLALLSQALSPPAACGDTAAAATTQSAGATTQSAVPAAKVEPGEADFQAGRTLFFQGQPAAAIDKLKSALAANPDKITYRLLLAKAYRLNGKADLAAAALEAILKANPDHVEAAVELAEMLLGRAQELDKTFAGVKQDKLKDLLAEKARQYDRIIALLEPLLKFKHDYPLYHLLAEAYYQKDNMAKAGEYFEQAVKLNPRSGSDFYELANIHLSQSHFAKAAEAYEKAHELGIDSGLLHYKLASVYSNLRNYLGKVVTTEVIGGEAGQVKNNLLLLDPVPGAKDTFYAAPPASAIYQVTLARSMMANQTPEMRFLEANIWLNARRYSRADAIYKTLEDKLDKSDQGLFWFYWSQAALGLDDYDNYLARLNKAIAVEPKTYQPTLPDANVTVARRYQQRGDNKRYIEYLAKAVQANPLSAGLHLTLGDAQWQLSDRTAAIAQYRLVLELEPDHADRIRLLNRVREVEATPAAPAPAPSAAG